MKNTIRVAAFGVAVSLAMTSVAQAALEGRDLDGNLATFEAYYDTDLDITWLADANYAKTSGYDMDGLMTWAEGVAWASSLSFTAGDKVYDNWRLPVSNDGCLEQTWVCEYLNMDANFVPLGELKSQFASLGGVPGSSITDTHGQDFALFQNIQAGKYWYGTHYSLDEGAWTFNMGSGLQIHSWIYDTYYVWAVHDGDVAAVPEPQAYVLMLAGVGLIGWRARRRG